VTQQDVFEGARVAEPSTVHDDEVMLRLNSVDKRYGSVHALKGVSLEVRRGQVHALVGENGAGKSTLVGVAAGSITADSGTVEIAGTESEAPTPSWCREQGLAIVYQEPALLPDLTVAENMALGMPEALRPTVSRQVEWATEILAGWSNVASIAADTPVRELKPDSRFVVEIARAFAEDPKVVVLDEPTEHLLPEAVEELFGLIQQRVEAGGAVVYISHRLAEVKRIAHEISVLRDGALVGTFEGVNVSESEVVNLIVGRDLEIDKVRRERGKGLGGDVLHVSGFSGRTFSDLELTVRAGEIVGFAGIEGQGQRDVLRALAGLGSGRGNVTVNGKRASTASAVGAQHGGIVYLPSDRHNEGVLSSLSIRENASLSALPRFSRAGVVSVGRERRAVGQWFGGLGVKAPSQESDIATLSGGNQQKVVLSRIMLSGARVILADEPTQGVDVGAREEIYEALRAAAREGIAIIVLSASTAELEQLCDRVLVFSRGKAVAELSGDQLTDHAITHAALMASESRADTVEKKQSRSRLRWLARSDLTPAGVLAIATIVLGLIAVNHSAYYLTSRNFGLILPLLATLAFYAMAQQLVMMIGGIDLSVGPLGGFLVVIGSFVLSATRTPIGLVLGIAIVAIIAAGVGTVNWLLTTIVKINPLIATLVTYTALQGVSYLLRPLPAGRIDPTLIANVGGKWGFMPVMAVLAIVVAVVLELMLYRSRRGARLRAVGSSDVIAKRVGISTKWVALAAYVGCSVMVVPAALLLMAQAGTGNATIGDSFTLASIGAAVLGGASIFGGRGSFLGAVLGAVLVTQINTVVQFLGLDLYWQQWLLGGLTLAAAAFYSKARSLIERSRA